jgi:MoaA/NifB/PqqE/SkfB family radical SAM enzyme
MTEEVFDKALEIAVEHGMHVTLGGGEPTLHQKCIEWAGRAAVELVDVTIGLGCPAGHIVTNGKKTEPARKLAKMSNAGIICAELSQDPWHDPIDPKTVDFFKRHAGIRNVSSGVKAQGRAKENELSNREACCCSALLITPNGDFYGCGCKTEKWGNILTDRIPSHYWENQDECFNRKIEEIYA